ncbi:MAG: ABC transporter ATP-binding protein [Azospirillaceae bacterium]|nr:ABC transporter ATP-binding protein [Azospirillaceae bacterium]
MTAAIGISAVRKTFPGAEHPALAGVSLDIAENEFFTLLGPSGCGKTTLLRIIAGFETPDAGELRLGGVAMGTTPPNKRSVNTVFQSYALFPHMSVAANIAFALEMLGRPRDAIRARVAEVMRLLRLEGLGDRRPNQLSGGQQQRVALGRALASAPKVLLLDEPLSALDLKLRRDMQIELKRLQAETGITFVFVTHDQEEALTMSNRIAVMRGGAVMQVGGPAEIYDRPADLFVADFIGEANLMPAVLVDRKGPQGRFRLTGSDALVVANDAGTIGVGEPAMLMVRPERIGLGPLNAAPCDVGVIALRVDALAYSGSDLMLHGALADGTRLRARLSGAAAGDAAVGDTVELIVPPDAVRVYRP